MDEYCEFSADWRMRDELIWATPAVIITVSGVLVKFAFDVSDLGIRSLLLVMGDFWVFAMIHQLIKHCYYQQGCEEQLMGLELSGRMLRRLRPKNQSANCMHRFFEKHSARMSLRYSSYLAFGVMLILTAFTIGNWFIQILPLLQRII